VFDRMVGEAYVLMRADGRLLKKDIEKLGKVNAYAYGQALEKEMQSATRLTAKRFQSQLAKGFAEMDFSGFIKEFGTVDETVQGLGGRLEEIRSRGYITETQFTKLAEAVVEWGEANRDRLADLDVAFDASNVAAIKRLNNELANASRTGDFSKLLKQFGSIEQTVDGVNDELDRMVRAGRVSQRQFDLTSQSLREWADEALRVRQNTEEARRVLVQYGDVLDSRIKGQWRDLAREIADASISGSFEEMRVKGEEAADTTARLTETLSKHRTELGLTEREYDAILDRMAEWQVRQTQMDKQTKLNDLLDGVVARRHPVMQALDDVDEKTQGFANTIGRAFGKGSRNDFLNFIGSFVGGMTRLVTSIPTTLIKTITHVGTAFSDGFSAARAAGLGRFAAAGRGIASIFAGKGGIAGALIGAAVAAVGFGKVLPAIASAVSMLAANAISLVGSVGVGLTGALLAVAPAAVAAAGGLGVLAAAWASWSDSKEGVKALKAQEKAFEEFFKTLYPAIREFNAIYEDAFIGIGKRVRPGILSLATDLEKLFDAKDTQGRLDSWGDSIEVMFGDISASIVNFTDGLIAFFVPILPYAEKLTGFIEQLSEDFATWAQSAEGQNSIADFMDRAWEAASALWDLLVEVGRLIGTVFDVGADETGTGWIQGWADAIADFNAYLQSPEGKAALKGWFDDAKEFGENVGRVLQDVGRIFTELDSPGGRETATKISEAIVAIADKAVAIASAADSVGKIVDDLLTISTPLNAVMDLLRGEVPDLSLATPDQNNEWEAKWDSMRESVSNWYTETTDTINQWGTDTANSIEAWVVSAGESISTFFTELPGNVSTWVSETWTAIEEGFQQGVTNVLDTMSQFLLDLATFIETFDLGEWLSTTWATIQENVSTFFSDLGTTIMEGLGTARDSVLQWATDTWNDFTTWGTGVGERVETGLAEAPGKIEKWATETKASFVRWVTETLATIKQWALDMPARIGEAIASAGAFLSALPGRVAGWLASLPERLSRPFREAWNRVNEYFDGAPGRLASAVGSVISSIAGRLSGVWETITGPFRRAWAEVQRILGQISNISIPNPFSGIDLTPWNASGNIYSGATVIGVGEAGPEAVVPLNRPLEQVNPKVRMLSAIAQGKAQIGVMGGASSQIVVQEGALQVSTRAADPNVVGSMVLEGLADAIANATGH
jgi:hypothetical protein